jgi:hypothetical protein
MSKEEIRKHFDKVYEEYRFSPERKKNVDRLRRKHGVTAKDLQQRFTI